LSRSRVNPNFVLAFPGHLALLLISTFQLWAFQPLAYLSVLLFRLVLFYSAIRGLGFSLTFGLPLGCPPVSRLPLRLNLLTY
jgi:hypothetical protein